MIDKPTALLSITAVHIYGIYYYYVLCDIVLRTFVARSGIVRARKPVYALGQVVGRT